MLHGSFEHAHDFDGFVWVGPASDDWPSVDGIVAQLVEDHYDLSDLPPVARTIVNQRERFDQVGSWRADGVQVATFVRR